MIMNYTFPCHLNWLEDDSSSSWPLNSLLMRPGFPCPGNPEVPMISLVSPEWEEEQSSRRGERKEEGQTSLTGVGELGLLGSDLLGLKAPRKMLHLLAEIFTAGRGRDRPLVLENACNSLKVDIFEWLELSPGVWEVGNSKHHFQSFPGLSVKLKTAGIWGWGIKWAKHFFFSEEVW